MSCGPIVDLYCYFALQVLTPAPSPPQVQKTRALMTREKEKVTIPPVNYTNSHVIYFQSINPFRPRVPLNPLILQSSSRNCRLDQ